MKDARATKRRRVSTDVDGDMEMGNDNQDVFAVPSSPDNDRTSPTPVKSAPRRRSIAAKTGQDGEDEKGEVQTPARVGTRSSGRQRKTPKRYEEEVVTPSSRRKPAATPRSARATRSAQKPRRSPVEGEDEAEVEEEDDDEEEEDDDDDDMDLDESSPEPAPRTSTRTRSKRSTAKPRPRPKKASAAEPKEKSPSPEYHDGLDDLVTMELQQDLYHEPEVHETVDISEPLPEYVEKLQALFQTGLGDEMRILSTIMLEKLSGKRQIPVRGLEPEYQKVHQLVEQTVSIGEGNSMLLLGSRGCGKTAIVESIISSLRKEHTNDFHVVRLNGFLHTDDRLALREMWRQLGREMHTEDDAAKVNSYADTMATLLALLSHPEELFGASGDPGSKTAAKSIVILLDEFDLFVTHPRQTLLYNLFDIAQARKAPIAVIGLTTKVDVTEMLEKRVKSRFSHRYTYVPLPRSFEAFSDICLGSLDLSDAEMVDIANELGPNRALVESNKWKTLLEGWKEYLKHMWDDKEFQFHLKRIYNQTKSVKEFFNSALLPISDLLQSVSTAETPTLEVPTAKSFASQSLDCPDPAPLPFSTSITSSSPSSLPLALLVAATRLAALFDPGNDGSQSQSMSPLALSFPAAYAEYVRLLTSAKISASVSGAAATPGRVWGRDVARESWEKLLSWGLVTPVGSGNGTADGQMFRVEISFEEVIEMAGSGGALGQWWRE
ncbi:uncharacterized protein N7479_000390 [Penicillium vulpinum]|uniref:Origin recognition complex subunit 4 n=1 Tax=Penicillium vulpinum TaxID=29845 RepID=A0A1V6S5W2_9EURO|nr:uncharacterized protein N7479_000390 [Penicillium vulpinum]KAJ5970472.1 hypothetical protein N7479_000390 [Penicillium vulpinum]OQE09258.1 hypothetical protein PENVUL_c007G05121 [Penicillium vulpinum]